MAADDLDIVIVGAGMAGLYAAWRLLEAGANPRSIGLFEADARVGGRVLTVRPREDETLALDLGAHNFHADHVRIGALVERFGLRTAPCAGQGPAGLLNLRGKTLSNAQVARSYFRKPFAYGISAYAQRRGPASILRQALRSMDGAGIETGGRKLGGKPLAEWPLDAAMLQVMSSEKLQYLGDRLSYSFWHTPIHAEAALRWTARELFHGSRPMSELPGGMSELPSALAAAIDALGGKIDLSHSLSGLDFPADKAELGTLNFETANGQRRTVRARRIILALPRAAIRLLDRLAAEPAIRALLAAVASQSAVTTALLYPDAWWQSVAPTAGVTVTDLPARHIRHYGAARGALMSYSDGANAEFWRNLAGSGAPSGWIEADHPIARELHRQAGLIFEDRLGRKLPLPLKAFTQDWQNSPSGAAFHLWAAGSDPNRAMADALKPFTDRALHICGETWSLRQGWIEGALDTVETMLTQHFGMVPFAGHAVPR